MKTRRIGLVGYDGVMALDIAGPADAFDTVTDVTGGDRRTPCYEVIVLGPGRAPFTSESGLRFTPRATLAEAPLLDTIIVPGGTGLRNPDTQRKIAQWIGTRALKTRRVASVCRDIRHRPDGASRRPAGRDPLEARAGRRLAFSRTPRRSRRTVPQGRAFLHVAGVTAGIDLSLALIEEATGRASRFPAAQLVVYLKRDGGQEQYSEPLQYQLGSPTGFPSSSPG